jgi:VWFA-related protein
VNRKIRILTVFFVALVAGVLAAQDAPFVLKVDSNAISVEVSVTDASNKPVLNLTRDAFSIYEDGELQPLTGFSSVEAPYSVLLLFDRSVSTENQWPLLQTALVQFVDALRKQDSVAIATFTDSTSLRLDWWSLSKGRPADVLSAVKIGDTTNFYGAIDWAANRLKKVNARKGVVVLSDGNDSTRIMHFYDPKLDSDFQKLVRDVWTARIPYYFVALNTDVNSKFDSPFGRIRMEQLAEASGGGIVFPKTADDIAPFFGDIARNLGTQYSLAYQQPKSSRDGKTHTIEVRLKDPSLTPRQTRNRYVSK